MKNIFIIITLFSLLIVISRAGSYFTQSRRQSKDVVIQELIMPDRSGRCDNGFIEYVSDSFSLCYPSEMQAFATAHEDREAIFSSDKEDLVVGYDSDKKWNIHLCNFEKNVTVASVSGVRTTFNQESTAGCGRPYRFVTMLEVGQEEFYIDLLKKDGTYADANIYDVIEQSVHIL